ncbi:phospholipase d zeta 1 [Fagus crenata]
MEKYPLLLLVEAVLALQSNHFLISPSPTLEPELCPPYCDGANQGKETHSKLHLNGLRLQHRDFAVEFKNGSQAQWFIFICGWWLCPELYLRHPFHAHASSRLDALLEAKAKQGVQIYILLYKEVALALKINSVYSKKKLLSIHENVRVLRYPDHFYSGVYLWSYHEKLVIIDYQICFIGGVDLCFGRYDTSEHKLVGSYSYFVGYFLMDIFFFHFVRESEPNSLEDTMKDELDLVCLGMMFIVLFGDHLRNKAPNDQAIPLLMPQQHMVIPHYMGKTQRRQDSFSARSSLQDIPLLLPQETDGLDAPSGEPKLYGLDFTTNLLDQPNRVTSGLPFSFRKSKIEPIGLDTPLKGFVDDFESVDRHGKTLSDRAAQLPMKCSDPEWWETQERGDQGGFADESGQVGPRASCHCQVIRSVSQWSAGTSQTEESMHSAYCSLIEKAEHFIYVENQFFISGLVGDEIICNRVLEALYQRIMRAYNDKKCFRVIVVIPLLLGFQYRTICRGHNSILHNLNDLLGPKTHDYISFYGLKAYGKLFDDGPVASSQVYVHSKIMIVDDCIALIGSANINDRSLLGSRDSEVPLLLDDFSS